VLTLDNWRARVRLGGFCLIALALGLSTFVILPLISFEEPLSRRAWHRWWIIVTGRAFQPKFIENTAKYDFPARDFAAVHLQLGWTGLVLAAAGLGAALWRRPLFGLALALAAGGNLWFFWNYQVHDIEVFFLPAVAIAVVLAGYAVEVVAEQLERRFDGAARWATPTLAAALSLWPLVPLPATYAAVDMSRVTEARAYARLLIDELPRDALFIKYNHPDEWKYYAVLLYVQQGLDQRHDVHVQTRPNLDRLDEELAAGRPVYAFADVRRVRKRVAVEAEGEFVRVVRTTHTLPRK
jgi:hypothetical protein